MASLEAALDDITVQRQTVMNWALAQKITEADMETKLAMLTSEEINLRRELDEKSLLIGNRAQKLLDFVHKYRARLVKGRAFLNCTPTTLEAAEEQFICRREIVDAIVTRVDVGPDKTQLSISSSIRQKCHPKRAIWTTACCGNSSAAPFWRTSGCGANPRRRARISHQSLIFIGQGSPGA